MSAISNVHSVVPFDSKTSRAFEGQRLSRITYKTVRKGDKAGTKKESKCVSIPQVTEITDTFIDAAMAYIGDMYKAAQDGIIRDLVDAGVTEIQDKQIDDDAVLAYLAAEVAGSRLTKEAVTEWFAESMADKLTVAFADKMGVSDTPTEDQTKIIAQAVEVYKDKFSGLAGGKTKYDAATAVKLLKALEVVEEGDEIAQKFNTRLVAMRDAPTGADMFGL